MRVKIIFIKLKKNNIYIIAIVISPFVPFSTNEKKNILDYSKMATEEYGLEFEPSENNIMSATWNNYYYNPSNIFAHARLA